MGSCCREVLVTGSVTWSGRLHRLRASMATGSTSRDEKWMMVDPEHQLSVNFMAASEGCMFHSPLPFGSSCGAVQLLRISERAKDCRVVGLEVEEGRRAKICKFYVQ